MSKVIEQNGRFFRVRRGKLVEIPAEWLGRATSAQTRRARAVDARLKRRTPSLLDRRTAADIKVRESER